MPVNLICGRPALPVVFGVLTVLTLLPFWVNAQVRAAPVAVPASAAAVGNSGEMQAVVIPADPCRIDVAKFERSIGFVRQSQGNKAADELREKLLPAKLQNTILSEQGYCGLAKYLNDKKLLK